MNDNLSSTSLTTLVHQNALQSLTTTKTSLDSHTSRQLSQSLEAGGAKLKKALRHINVPAGDPQRVNFWQKIITARTGQKISTDLGVLDPGVSSYRTHMIDKQLTSGFHITDPGRVSILRVLHCLGQQTPSLVYAPMLYPLTALLLHYMSEKEALACLEVLLTQENMIIQVVEDWKQHCHSMEYLSRRHAKTAHRLLREPGIDKDDLAHWSLVVWMMPFDFIVRIVDCFLFEGIKVLYRAGLVIWKETYIRYAKDTTTLVPDNLRDPLQRTAISIANSYSPQTFLNRMFRVRNVSWASIQRARSQAAQLPKCSLEMRPLTSVAKQFLAFSGHHTNPSHIASRQEVEAIIEQLEERIAQLQCPVLIFTTEHDGTSLQRMVRAASEFHETILLVRTMDNEVFGAFCADSWRRHDKRFFGRGSSFVFTLKPELQFYRWVDQPGNPLCHLFQKLGTDHLHIGGGDQGNAIELDAGLSRGVSNPSTTFRSPRLTSKQDFMVGTIEMLAFEDVPVA